MHPIPFKGISMKPLLIEGDLILIEKMDDHFKIGEILLFKDMVNGEFVVHRVIQKDPLLTKGDWTISSESPELNEVFAKVIGFNRGGEIYSFNQGFLFKLYCSLSQKLLSPFRPLRQGIRLLLPLISPFLASKKA